MIRKIPTRRGAVWANQGRIYLELDNNGAPLLSLSEPEARELLHALTAALVPQVSQEEPDEWIPSYVRILE